PELLSLSLHDALPISEHHRADQGFLRLALDLFQELLQGTGPDLVRLPPDRIAEVRDEFEEGLQLLRIRFFVDPVEEGDLRAGEIDRKSTRLNSSHVKI